MIRLSLIPQLDPLILHNTRLVYVCVHFVQEESFPPCIKFIINHHIWWVCSVLQFPWGESRGNIDHIHSRTPLSINFRYLTIFTHSLICDSSSSCLLPLIAPPTQPNILLHLFTEADNEPHWAVMGFHGVSRGFSAHSTFMLFFVVVSRGGDFPTISWTSNQVGNHFQFQFLNILPFKIFFEWAGMNIACALIWIQ